MSTLQSPQLGSSQWGTVGLPNNNTLGLQDVPPPALQSDQQQFNADVWSLYNKVSKPVDAKYIRIWVNGLNGIMIFAALFAGVISTLLVDSKQLLRPDSDDTTQALLYFLAVQTTATNHTDVLPSTLDPSIAAANFKPPRWAVLVNGCFLTSLTFSVLAALGAIVCLEWVLEYDEPPESAPSIRYQALRRHFRFKAMKTWYMGRLIVTLPLMLYLVVVIFFMGLTIWVWHTCQSLATLPLLGIIFTVGGSFVTNAAAVYSPSVPFQTVTTKGILRACVTAHISMWYVMEMSPFWFKRLWIYMSIFFQPDGHVSKRKAEQRLYKSRMERSRNWKGKVRQNYPWMPEERTLRIGVHADRREEHTITKNQTLKLSALAWLANFIQLCPESAPYFASILEEMNSLKKDEIQPWGSSDFEAPWGSIFKTVVNHYHDPASRTNGNISQWREVVAELQVKMVNNPLVFSRIVSSILQPGDLYEFLRKLQEMEKSPLPCGNVMKGICTILSHPELDRSNHHLSFEILGFILQYLQVREHDVRLSVAWVFPLCATTPGQLENLQWDDVCDEGLSFSSIECSSTALSQYIMVADDFIFPPRLQNSTGSHRAGIYLNNQYIAIALLTDYLVREHRRYHMGGIFPDIPTPRFWALRLVHDNITGKQIDEVAFRDLCDGLGDPETSIVSSKVIQVLAPSMTLPHWTEVFIGMDKLSSPDLKEAYTVILPAFVDANLILPQKQKNKIKKATTMIANVFRLGPSRQNTSNVENGAVGTPRAHGTSSTPLGSGTPLGTPTPKSRRTASSTPAGSIATSEIESKFLTSLSHILQRIMAEDPEPIRSLQGLIDEKRRQPLHENFPALDAVYEVLTGILSQTTHQPGSAPFTVDLGTSGYGSGIPASSASSGIPHRPVELAPAPALSPIQEQPVLDEQPILPESQAYAHSPQVLTRSLPDFD
ncbi:hypothetical protein FRC19_011012 [Serendipita sp. 401]|nr:hypothetical protein FRC19_011012 [Serendipita sp. 401]KAG9052435.1 hypothetical protein FS842_009856 [Serendipita sp. 407]